MWGSFEPLENHQARADPDSGDIGLLALGVIGISLGHDHSRGC